MGWKEGNGKLRRSVTIRDVARKAGVAPSTVSRVIANNPLISKETQLFVRQAMEELGYVPNAMARSLANAVTWTIAIVMPRSAELAFQNPFFPEVIRGIASKTSEKKYDLLLLTPVTAEDEYLETMRVVKEHRVDGVIFLHSRTDQHLLQELADLSVPLVVVGRPLGEFPISWVDNDNIDASKQATDTLIGLGHEKIGFVSGPLDLVVSLDRQEGYKRALVDCGLKWDPSLIRVVDFLEEGGYQATAELLDSFPEMTALVVADDIMAFGAMRAARERNLKLPNDISIVSFNNTPMGQYMDPPLSSVEIQAHELGVEAADLLLHQLVERKIIVDRRIVPSELIMRKSIAEVPNLFHNYLNIQQDFD